MTDLRLINVWLATMIFLVAVTNLPPRGYEEIPLVDYYDPNHDGRLDGWNDGRRLHMIGPPGYDILDNPVSEHAWTDRYVVRLQKEYDRHRWLVELRRLEELRKQRRK